MVVRRFLANAGIAFTKQLTLERLVSNERLLQRNANFPEFASYINPDFLGEAIALLPHSQGEIFQDIFAALMTQDHASGYFVEFGATDGIAGSNTWLLENHLGWGGLLAEPAHG